MKLLMLLQNMPHVGNNGEGALGFKESFTEAEASLAPGEALATTIKVKLHEFGIIIQAMRGYG